MSVFIFFFRRREKHVQHNKSARKSLTHRTSVRPFQFIYYTSIPVPLCSALLYSRCLFLAALFIRCILFSHKPFWQRAGYRVLFYLPADVTRYPVITRDRPGSAFNTRTRVTRFTSQSRDFCGPSTFYIPFPRKITLRIHIRSSFGSFLYRMS